MEKKTLTTKVYELFEDGKRVDVVQLEVMKTVEDHVLSLLKPDPLDSVGTVQIKEGLIKKFKAEL